MHKILKNMIILALAFVTSFSSFAASESLSNISVETAPLSSQQPTLNGMVRVYLSSLGSSTNLTLTISGSYSLSNGTALSNGEILMVSFNSSSGAITLLRGGTAFTMGSSFTVRRHSTTGINGIKITQARKPGNLYPGDVQFKAVSQSDGGYKLYTIAHIYIEDYLYGVVPYEMGSSAPLEALKSQAVAARTYTVRIMNARSSWSYDVVDTTSDQTYNGTPTSVTNCNTAVDQTKGILLKNGSSYTATYYSASNGGQIESIKNAWGTSGYDYLGVKDDPFDYANPASIVKQTTLYQDASNSANNTSLISLLKTKAVSALSIAGYNASASNTTVQTIKSVSAHTPMYVSPSKLYTKMDFTLTITTYNAGNVFVSVTTTVSCNIFSELESMLSMSIQAGKNELWSVVQSGTTFKLQARRYGHGIGMSQRGAMYMGQLGYTYDEILGFYYPSSTRVGCVFKDTILSADSYEVISTDENPVDISDNNTTVSGVRGIVTLSNNAQLAVRNAKYTTAKVLTVLPNGSPVDVLANDGTWCLISFGSITGYVPASALSILGTAPVIDNSEISSIDGFALVTADGYLNLREMGDYSASIVTTVPNGAILTVLSWSTPWAHIQYGTIVAYASSDFLSFSAEYPEEIGETAIVDCYTTGDSSETEMLSAIIATQSGSLNVRRFPQAGSTILTTVPKAAIVSVTSKGDIWSGVKYLGVDGYVMTMFLSFEDDSTDTGEEQTTGLQAMVWTQSGSLNLRQQPKIGSSIYGTIPRMEIIQVHSKDVDWCQVTYAGVTGYVMSAFLTFVDPEDMGGDDTEDSNDSDNSNNEDDSSDHSEDEPLTAIVTTESGSLNLRSDALSDSKVLVQIPKGETIVVLQRLNTWTYTCYQEYYGYVMNSYLTFSDDGIDPTETINPISATVVTNSGSLNLRDEPNGNVLTQIPQHEIVDVYTEGSAWCYLKYNGIFGYAMTLYLSFENDSTQETDTTDNNGEPSEHTDETSQNDTSTQSNTATVMVETGMLNLRVARSDTADVLTTIPNGTIVSLLSQGDYWSKITFGVFQGYVQTQYLTFSISEESHTNGDTADDPYSCTAWVSLASGSLNLRESASETSTVLTQIPNYAQVEVLSDIQATWCKTRYGEVTGYTMTEFITTTQPIYTAAESDTGIDNMSTETELPMDQTLHEPNQETIVYVRPPAGSATLALYAACSEDSERINRIAENTQVEVIRVGNTWCEVLYLEQQGYCLRDGLSFFDE